MQSREILTIRELLELGFKTKIEVGELILKKNDYILKSELGYWLVIGNHSGIKITGLELLGTIIELKQHYYLSTGRTL